MRKIDDFNLLCTSINKRTGQNRNRPIAFDVYEACRSDIITHERIGPFDLLFSISSTPIILVDRAATYTAKQQTFRFCIRQEQKNAAS